MKIETQLLGLCTSSVLIFSYNFFYQKICRFFSHSRRGKGERRERVGFPSRSVTLHHVVQQSLIQLESNVWISFFLGENRVTLVIRANFTGTVFLEIKFKVSEKIEPAKLVRITRMTLYFRRKIWFSHLTLHRNSERLFSHPMKPVIWHFLRIKMIGFFRIFL